MSKIEKGLVTGKTHTTVNGPGGTSRGHDGSLDIQLSSSGNGANPALCLRLQRGCGVRA